MTSVLEIISDFGRGGSERSMQELVAAAKDGLLGALEVNALAVILARSGETVIPADGNTADLASTGSPTSLSTLLGPLFLRAFGYTIVKLGVPGRPAGGIDVMAQVPGYRISMDGIEIRRVLASCGYAHFIAGSHFAPMDAALFAFRQRVGGQAVASLASASLLSKKIACGVTRVCVDVRVAPHGNFGDTIEVARESAKVFCDAAKLAGITAICAITDARFPYQPYIGRGESLVALAELMEGEPPPLLEEHFDRCHLMACTLAARDKLTVNGISRDEIRYYFESNLEAQGASRARFLEKVDQVKSAHKLRLAARNPGFVSINLPALRSLFSEIHSRQSGKEFPDELGVILSVSAGQYVGQGSLLATARAPVECSESVLDALERIITVTACIDLAPGMEIN